MSSVRGNSKSSARRMRLNLADGNYSEMMEWNTTETLKNQSMEECQTRMGEEDTNSTIGDMNSSNVSVHNVSSTYICLKNMNILFAICYSYVV